MRAPNLLSLVVTSGCCLFRAVTAFAQAAGDNVGPQNAGITPNLEPGSVYTVTWAGCSTPCHVNGFALLQVQDGGSPITITSEPITAFAVLTAPAAITSSASYEVALEWVAGPALSNSQQFTTGIPFIASVGAGSTGEVGVGVAPSVSVSLVSGAPIASPTTGSQTPSTTDTERTSAVPPPPVPTSSGIVPETTGLVPGPPPQSQEPSPTSTAAGVLTASGSSGLSTGAKVGIAIGTVGIVLIVLIGALLIWRRRRQHQLRALPDGMPYSHDTGSTNRDLTAEKEMNVINSPVDTLHNGYSAVPNPPLTQNQAQTGSWASPDQLTAAAVAPYPDAHRRSHGSAYADSSPPGSEMQSAPPPQAAVTSGSAIQRKPVGAASGATHHLREPGMSDEEVARLEEEERRLDEAIAEAERKRHVQG